MQRKIEVAAPDDARFGKQRTQMLCRVQAVHTRKGDHGIGRRGPPRGLKKMFLLPIIVHAWKQTAFRAEPRDLLRKKSFPCFAVAEDGSMEVNSLNMNKLVQSDGDTLILDGGNAAV